MAGLPGFEEDLSEEGKKQKMATLELQAQGFGLPPGKGYSGREAAQRELGQLKSPPITSSFQPPTEDELKTLRLQAEGFGLAPGESYRGRTAAQQKLGQIERESAMRTGSLMSAGGVPSEERMKELKLQAQGFGLAPGQGYRGRELAQAELGRIEKIRSGISFLQNIFDSTAAIPGVNDMNQSRFPDLWFQRVFGDVNKGIGGIVKSLFQERKF